MNILDILMDDKLADKIPDCQSNNIKPAYCQGQDYDLCQLIQKAAIGQYRKAAIAEYIKRNNLTEKSFSPF